MGSVRTISIKCNALYLCWFLCKSYMGKYSTLLLLKLKVMVVNTKYVEEAVNTQA